MIRIGGLEKVSLLDYPGKVSTIIFTYGCNLRCEFCHNPELVIYDFNEKVQVTENFLFDYLKKRKGIIDAVVITGGEPLIYPEIDTIIRRIRDLGYLVKLDTNGFFPEKLRELIESRILDYIAMDVKYNPKDYIKRTGDSDALMKVKESIKLIKKSGIDYEFRTTYVKGIHKMRDSEDITYLIKNSKKYYIQNFRPGKTINPKLDILNSFKEDELEKILSGAKKYVKNSFIR